jgi:hypothetical protein
MLTEAKLTAVNLLSPPSHLSTRQQYPSHQTPPGTDATDACEPAAEGVANEWWPSYPLAGEDNAFRNDLATFPSPDPLRQIRWVMFSRQTRRKKDGKTHSYWSVVENQRLGGGHVVQRLVLYLGEISPSPAAA